MSHENEKKRFRQECETAISQEHIERLIDAAQSWLHKLPPHDHDELLSVAIDNHRRCSEEE